MKPTFTLLVYQTLHHPLLLSIPFLFLSACSTSLGKSPLFGTCMLRFLAPSLVHTALPLSESIVQLVSIISMSWQD
jgi:hypothetical protein